MQLLHEVNQNYWFLPFLPADAVSVDFYPEIDYISCDEIFVNSDDRLDHYTGHIMDFKAYDSH